MRGVAALLLGFALCASASAARLVGFAGGAALNAELGGAQVEVPDCVSGTLSECVALLDAVNLLQGDTTVTCTDEDPPGTVLSQDPVATTMVDEFSSVDLVVASACAGGVSKRLIWILGL